MAIDTGDLLPRASGSASLGVEQLGICGFTTDVRPFCHVHQNSGVFHAPLAGNSGVIRYSQGKFETSEDGGNTFSRLVKSLDDAYSNGNLIELDAFTTDRHVPVLLKDKPGVTNLDDLGSIPRIDDPEKYSSFLISGVAPASDDTILRKAALGLSSNGIAIRASGNTTVAPATYSLSVGSFNPALIRLNSSGTYIHNHNGAYITEVSQAIDIASSTSASFGADQDVTIGATVGQVQINSFDQSGRLVYRFGPYEAWHTKNGAGDDTLIPIPHSGHVQQMIDASLPNAATMQSVYEENPLRILDDGDIISIADTGKHKFSTFGSRATINVSGIFDDVPSSDLEIGDISMLTHAAAPTASTSITSKAVARALSLGPGHLQLNTGSGIAQIPIASGLNRQIAPAASQSLATFPTYTSIVLNRNTIGNDKFFEWDGSVTGVRILVPGLYHFIGKITLSGSNTASAFSRITLNGVEIQAGGAADVVFNGFFTTVHQSAIFNCQANDIVRLQGSVSVAGAASTLAAASDLIVEYKGPRRN